MEEYETLLDSEKASAIRSKIKNLQYLKYNIELDILSENAISNPNITQIDEWNNQLLNLNAKEDALQSELNSINQVI